MSIVDGVFKSLSSSVPLEPNEEFVSAIQDVTIFDYLQLYILSDQIIKIFIELTNTPNNQESWQRNLLELENQPFKEQQKVGILLRGYKYIRLCCQNIGSAKTKSFQICVGSNAITDQPLRHKRVDAGSLHVVTKPNQTYTDVNVNSLGALYVSAPVDAETQSLAKVSKDGALHTIQTIPVGIYTFMGSSLDETQWVLSKQGKEQLLLQNSECTLLCTRNSDSEIKIVSTLPDLPCSGKPITAQFIVRPETQRGGVQRWGLETADQRNKLYFEFGTALFSFLSKHRNQN